ncbi:hypothetical protein GFY24_38665 [Nocardia sp. SYP-A9097]|uniref:hypothetical protein n=1 Tax=Nocardia sp. SYP-A9097 TaxID=2663237 RepID=UPI00129BC41B|nr:hypothetical protein [Nocardia sp. SYP-A9097]MRH93274.1 hypothetical protein [Nocardia sp. SYP-A9097]
MTRRTVVVRMLAVVTALLLPCAAPAVADTHVSWLDPYVPANGVEATYSQPGPWAVTAQKAFGCCDSTGAAYDLWYPADLGVGGFRHPIITWGDGTFAVPSQYDSLLAHLASWGFVVIATENQQTGSGVDIAGAADFLLRQADDPASVFHNHVDPNAIGAMGHSPGPERSMP